MEKKRWRKCKDVENFVRETIKLNWQENPPVLKHGLEFYSIHPKQGKGTHVKYINSKSPINPKDTITQTRDGVKIEINH